MKNLLKLVVLVIMVIAATSCNGEQKELEKAEQEKAERDSIQKVRAEKKKEIFLYAVENLPDTFTSFFEGYFKGKNMEMYTGVNEYYILKKGDSVKYSNQDMDHNGTLTRDVITMNLNGLAWVKSGFMGKLSDLNKEIFKFEIHRKTKYERKLGSKLVGMHELCVETPNFEGLHPTLESFYEYINKRDDYGYTSDIVWIWDSIYVLEMNNGIVMAFDYNGNLIESRRNAHKRRGHNYDETVVQKFSLEPHYKK